MAPAGRLPREAFRLVAWFVGLLCLAVVLPSVQIATEVVILALGAISCQVLLAYGPLLSFAQGAFFGIGAYGGGLYVIATQGSPWSDAVVAAVLGAALAALVAFAVGAVALRRVAAIGVQGAGGVTFLMLTFALAQVVHFAATIFPRVTGGENGLLDIPRAHGLLILGLQSPFAFHAFCAAILAAVIGGIGVASRSVLGQACKAIESNERRAAAVGYNVYALRLALFSGTGGIAGLGGCLYGQFLGLVPLSVVDLSQGGDFVIAAVLGGAASPVGALLGTICLVLGADLLSQTWPHWKLPLGGAIILAVLAGRGGLLSIAEMRPRWPRVRRALAVRRDP
jgi:branched-chain amino acid transport system permease protein